MRQNKNGSHSAEPIEAKRHYFIWFLAILLVILIGIYFVCYANRYIFYDYIY